MRKFLNIMLTLIFAVSSVFAVMLYLHEYNRDYKEAGSNDEGGRYSVQSGTKEHYEYNFSTVDADYFDDALFIGDSRTVGLQEYSGLTNADYFAKVGLTVYGVSAMGLDTDYGCLSLLDMLSRRQYGKVYLMFGVNELQNELEKNATEFCKLIATVRQYQPDAIIYIEANLHVGESYAARGEMYGNDRLNSYNLLLASQSDGEKVFYIDVNEIFDDENGNLSSEYTTDGLHLSAQFYPMWTEFLKSHAIE